VGRPDILFLDEPTTGLDPRSRIDVWAFIRELQEEGTTILLTTQYLDEADQLADRITVVDLGEVIAEGTSDQLKDRIGGEVLEIDVEDASETKRAADALQGLGTGEPNVNVDEGLIRLPVGTEGTAVLRDATRRLDQIQIPLAGFAVHRPTLDDVFMSLTGRAAEDGAEPEPEGKRRRGRKGTA
jgi:ABC-2 type transport system ATP-binding protein